MEHVRYITIHTTRALVGGLSRLRLWGIASSTLSVLQVAATDRVGSISTKARRARRSRAVADGFLQANLHEA